MPTSMSTSMSTATPTSILLQLRRQANELLDEVSKLSIAWTSLRLFFVLAGMLKMALLAALQLATLASPWDDTCFRTLLHNQEKP